MVHINTNKAVCWERGFSQNRCTLEEALSQDTSEKQWLELISHMPHQQGPAHENLLLFCHSDFIEFTSGNSMKMFLAAFFKKSDVFSGIVFRDVSFYDDVWGMFWSLCATSPNVLTLEFDNCTFDCECLYRTTDEDEVSAYADAAKSKIASLKLNQSFLEVVDGRFFKDLLSGNSHLRTFWLIDREYNNSEAHGEIVQGLLKSSALETLILQDLQCPESVYDAAKQINTLRTFTIEGPNLTRPACIEDHEDEELKRALSLSRKTTLRGEEEEVFSEEYDEEELRRALEMSLSQNITAPPSNAEGVGSDEDEQEYFARVNYQNQLYAQTIKNQYSQFVELCAKIDRQGSTQEVVNEVCAFAKRTDEGASFQFTTALFEYWLRSLYFKKITVPGDGNCLFYSLLHLAPHLLKEKIPDLILGTTTQDQARDGQAIRNWLVSLMYKQKPDDYIAYLDENDVIDSEHLPDKLKWAIYCEKMKEQSMFPGQLELVILANELQRKFVVYDPDYSRIGGNSTVNIEPENYDAKLPQIHLARQHLHYSPLEINIAQ